MKTQKNTAARRGFTLVELVAVLAIMAIMAAFAVPPMLSYSEMGHQMNRDAIARTIYLSAQNRLTELRITNNLKNELTKDYYTETPDPDPVTGNTVYTLRSDADLKNLDTNVYQGLGRVDANLAEDSANAPYLHYISKKAGEKSADNPVLKLLDPIFLDKTVLNDAILIEYNIRTGVVFSVFYGEHAEEFNYTGTGTDKNSVKGTRGMGEGGYAFANERRQGYYGVGKTGFISDQLSATINVYDSSDRPLPDDTAGNYDNLLYAELLVPTKNIQESALFDLRINGITVEKVDLTKVTATSFANDALPIYPGSDCLLYRYDTDLVDTNMARFIWILDYVGGNMADSSATGNNIKHSIGVKYNGKEDLNKKTSIGGSSPVTLKLDGTSNLRVSLAGNAIAESSTEANPYYMTQGGSNTKRFSVKTARHLYNVRYALDGNFNQFLDIDLAQEYNKVQNFAPIGWTWNKGADGTLTGPTEGFFTGTYTASTAEASNGSGVIKNLTIDLLNQDQVGLFSHMAKPSAANTPNLLGLTLQDPSIKGKNTVGALCGELTTGFISNCAVYYTSESITTKDGIESVKSISGTQNVGGMVGVNTAGRVMDSIFLSPTAKMHVAGPADSTGGIVGQTATDADLQRILYLALAPKSSDGQALYPFVGKNSQNPKSEEKLYYLSGLVDKDKRPTSADFGQNSDESVAYNIGAATLGAPMGTHELYTLDAFNQYWAANKNADGTPLTVEQIMSNKNAIYPYHYPSMLKRTLPVHPNWPIVDDAFSARMLYYEIYADDQNAETAEYGVYQTPSSSSFTKEPLLGKVLQDNRKIMEDGYLFYCDEKYSDQMTGNSTKLFVSSSPSGENYLSGNATGVKITENITKLGGIHAILLDMEQLQKLSLGGKPLYMSLSKGDNNGNGNDKKERNYYEGYINPLFAKALYRELPPAEQSHIIRTPRQMNNIGHVSDVSKINQKGKEDYTKNFVDPLGKDLTYTQEIDMDFDGLNSDTGYQMRRDLNNTESILIDISNSVVPGAFAGSYQGNQKEIRNLVLDGKGSENVGLFASNAGSIQALTLKSATITNGINLGGLAAQNSGTIQSSSVQYSTVGDASVQTVGGMVGQNSAEGNIENVYFLSMNVPTDSPVQGKEGASVGGIVGNNQGAVSRALYLAPAPQSKDAKETTLYPIAGKNSKNLKDDDASCFYLSGSRYSLDKGKNWEETEVYNRTSGIFGNCIGLTTSFFDKSWLATDYEQAAFGSWKQQPRIEDDTANMSYPYPVPPTQNLVRWPTDWPLVDSPVRHEQKDRDFQNPKELGNRAEEIKFVNGSFDENPPAIPPNISHIITPMDQISGWFTRPTDPNQESNPEAAMIELQYPYLKKKMNYNDFAYSDAKGAAGLYAELNANLPGTLYQIAPTTPKQEFYYSFFHMTRREAVGNTTNATSLNRMNFYLTGVGPVAQRAEDKNLVLIRPCWSARAPIGKTQDQMGKLNPVPEPKDDLWNTYAKDTIYYGQVSLPYYKDKLKDFDGTAHLYDVWMPQLGYGITVWSEGQINNNTGNFPNSPSPEKTNGSAGYLSNRGRPFYNDQWDRPLAEKFYEQYKDQILGYWDVSYGWKQYYGSYTVPKDQLRTEFAYQSNASNKTSSVGNFLDEITFRSPAFLTVNQNAKIQNADGSSEEVRFVKPGDTVQIEVHVKNLGELAAKNITIDNQFAPFDDYISYQANSVKVYKGTQLLQQFEVDETLDDEKKTLSIKLPEAVMMKTDDTLRVTFDLKVNTTIQNNPGAASTLLYYFRNQAKVTYSDDEFVGFAPRDNVSNVVKIAIDPIRLSKTVTPNPMIVESDARDFTVTLSIEDITTGQSMKSSGMITDTIPPAFQLVTKPDGASEEASGENTILMIPKVTLTADMHKIEYMYTLRYTGDGYGVRYTSLAGVSAIGADYRYRFQDEGISGIAERVSVLLGFPQTIVALRPTLQDDAVTVGNTGALLDILANDTSLKKKYAHDNYDVTPEVALTDASGNKLTPVDGSYKIITDQYTATLVRGQNTLNFVPKTNADGTHQLYYKVFLTAQKEGAPSFVLDSNVATVTIVVENSNKRVYYEKYTDGNYGFYTGEENQTVPPLDDTQDADGQYKTIVEAGYGVLSRSSDRALAVNSGSIQSDSVAINSEEATWYLYAPKLEAKKDWTLSTLTFGTFGSMESVAKLHPNFAKAIYPPSASTVGNIIYIRTETQKNALKGISMTGKKVVYEHGMFASKALLSEALLPDESAAFSNETTAPGESTAPEEVLPSETPPEPEEVLPSEPSTKPEEALPPKEIPRKDAAPPQQEGETRTEGRRMGDMKKRGGRHAG